jgi:2-polyprenyl-6-methoxyphenol hydroxylase-like FAD-dependent oxidoreductase
MTDCPIIIVGAGPVGLIAAIDLAQRGVRTIVLERRSSADPANPRCNTTSARTMEILRELGIADEYRACGLPADYPNDVRYSTRINGTEITRYTLASSGSRFEDDRKSHDGGWNSVERPHRVSQLLLERVLRRKALSLPEIDLRFDHECIELEQDDERVLVTYRNVESGEQGTISASYLIGADGGRSTIRRAIGVKLIGGYTQIARAESVYFRSSAILDLFPGKPAWMNWVINKDMFGNLIAIDGKELWLAHVTIPDGQEGIRREDFDRQIQETLGAKVEYEVISQESWQLNRLVADTYRINRVFLAGDAAHSWPPWAGHGMNTGIEDGMGLSWLLAGALAGWLPQSALDAYQAERQNVGDKISQAAVNMASAQHEIAHNLDLRTRVEEAGEEGLKARQYIRNRLIEADSIQFNPQGLNFGLQYDASPLIIYDEEEAPEFAIASYKPSTVPGCRAPHFAFIETGEPLIDRLGKGFALLVSDDEVDVSGLTGAAADCGMPLTTIDVAHEPKAREFFRHKLVLVRPDKRIAWRANEAPGDPRAIIDKVRGA